jgi:dihydrofolate synthase/folylpolyglutamate synthase
MAVALVYHWVSRYWLRLTSQEFSRAVREAFARVRWPGRFERVREADPPVWVDVAHTPAAVEAVAITAAEVFPAPPVLLLGASQGRDPARLLGRLLVRPRAVVVTRPPERGADSRAVAAALVALAPHVAIQAVEAPAEALAVACDLARDAERPLLVTGSYFLARVVAELLDAAAGDVGKQGGTTRSAGT